jgi:hypothetical protein
LAASECEDTAAVLKIPLALVRSESRSASGDDVKNEDEGMSDTLLREPRGSPAPPPPLVKALKRAETEPEPRADEWGKSYFPSWSPAGWSLLLLLSSTPLSRSVRSVPLLLPLPLPLLLPPLLLLMLLGTFAEPFLEDLGDVALFFSDDDADDDDGDNCELAAAEFCLLLLPPAAGLCAASAGSRGSRGSLGLGVELRELACDMCERRESGRCCSGATDDLVEVDERSSRSPASLSASSAAADMDESKRCFSGVGVALRERDTEDAAGALDNITDDDDEDDDDAWDEA